MNPFPAILVGLASITAALADVAASANYGMTILSIDSGGQRSGSANYTNDLAIGRIAGRAVAPTAVQNFLGYVAQMNNPPVAFDDVRSHPVDAPIDLPSEFFLANDNDIDNDPIQVLSVNPLSEALASVSYSRGHIFYTSPAGFTGVDRFNYILLDSNGDMDVATVTVAVAPPIESQPMNTLSIMKLADGRYLLRLRQAPNRIEYHIQTATDLNLEDWADVLYPAQLDGIIEIIVNPADGAQRYFRSMVFE